MDSKILDVHIHLFVAHNLQYWPLNVVWVWPDFLESQVGFTITTNALNFVWRSGVRVALSRVYSVIDALMQLKKDRLEAEQKAIAEKEKQKAQAPKPVVNEPKVFKKGVAKYINPAAQWVSQWRVGRLHAYIQSSIGLGTGGCRLWYSGTGPHHVLAKFLQKFLRYDMNVLYLHVCVDGNVVTILGMDNSVLCTYLLHVRDIRKSRYYSFLKYSSDPNLTKPFSLCTENELLTAKTELLWRKSERKKQKRHCRISVPGDRRLCMMRWYTWECDLGTHAQSSRDQQLARVGTCRRLHTYM